MNEAYAVRACVARVVPSPSGKEEPDCAGTFRPEHSTWSWFVVEQATSEACRGWFLRPILRSAARLVLRKRKFDSISSDMRDKLHWLPVKQRIEYKIGMLVYKCRRNEAPAYLVEMLHPVVPSSRYNLRSESEKMYDFDIPRTRSVRSGPRSFSVSGPTLWNSLPFSVKEAASLNIGTFKKVLKTILFSNIFNTVWLGNICLFMNCTGAFVTVLP